MNSERCSQCKHFIIANAREGKIYGCDRSKCVFEPTTKNDLADDFISREAVDRIINKWLSHPDYELKDHIYSMTEKIHNLPSVTPQEPILDELRAEITTLQNRCYALTKGTMCAFCKYECEYKAETEKT